MKKAISSIVIVLVLVISSIGYSVCAKSSFDQVPNFTAKDIYGNVVTNDILKDKELTLINVWATWCGPCKSELPELKEVYDEVKAKNVNVLGLLGGDSDVNEAVKLVKQNGINYTNVMITGELESYIESLEGFPTSILVNSKGERVADIILGSRSKAEFLQVINDALDNVEPSELSVNITNPKNGRVFTNPKNIVIKANATSNGTNLIQKVDFYANGVLVSTDTTAPYAAKFAPSVKGNYALKAVVTDDANNVKASEVVNIKVRFK